MKWLNNRYTYPVLGFGVAMSIMLQVVWLREIYLSQRLEVKRELETLVGESTQMNTYLTVAPGHEQSRNFFLSPEWLQFFYAFNSLHVADSSFLHVKFGFSTANDMTPAELAALDKRDQHRVDSMMREKMLRLPVAVRWYPVVSSYSIDTLETRSTTDSFYSRRYAYNFSFLNLYQVVVPRVRGLVLYKMRYYLAYSLFLLALTITAFLFMLRALRNQRLYTLARLAFTSNMTHELKTPVATVALALESILENKLENDPATFNSYLTISRNELKRLNLMIDKVLKLDQLDNGQTRLRTELFDIQDGLRDVITSMQLQIENAGAVVTLNLPENPCFVKGDPVHLTSVFFNLIENALKFSPSPLRLDIAAVVGVDVVAVSFKDNGPGIDKLYHARIFDRYFRVPAAAKDVHDTKGSGLGLNYVQQVIQQHAGRIKLESEKGKGSTFIISLPLAT